MKLSLLLLLLVHDAVAWLSLTLPPVLDEYLHPPTPTSTPRIPWSNDVAITENQLKGIANCISNNKPILNSIPVTLSQQVLALHQRFQSCDNLICYNGIAADLYEAVHRFPNTVFEAVDLYYSRIVDCIGSTEDTAHFQKWTPNLDLEIQDNPTTSQPEPSTATFLLTVDYDFSLSNYTLEAVNECYSQTAPLVSKISDKILAEIETLIYRYQGCTDVACLDAVDSGIQDTLRRLPKTIMSPLTFYYSSTIRCINEALKS